jgi:ribosomal protein L31E
MTVQLRMPKKMKTPHKSNKAVRTIRAVNIMRDRLLNRTLIAVFSIACILL